MRFLIMAATMLLSGAAQAQGLTGPMKPLAFLLGHWQGGGAVSETGGRSSGASVMTAEANGEALLRRDHTDLYDKTGKPAGGFDQIMLIYPEADGLHADYSDGQHLIHYGVARIVEGRSVEFASLAPPGAPVFHLRYDVDGPDTLKLVFGMVPPGASAIQPIATGELHRVK